MKVLYIGYYKEDSDWGKITSNNILALDAAGIDVVCRNFRLTRDNRIATTPIYIQINLLTPSDFSITMTIK